MPQENAYQEFLGLLLPKYLSPSIVVPRVALKLAGININIVKPVYTQFGPSFPHRFYMEIGDITAKEAEKIAKFFRTIIKDPDVQKSVNHANSMEVIQHYQSFYFLLSRTTFENNFLPLFKNYLETMSVSELAEYQSLSANDYVVNSYKKMDSLLEDIAVFEVKYKKQELATTLQQIRLALQNYPTQDNRMVELCNTLKELIKNDRVLNKDKKLCLLRDAILDHSSTVLFHPIQCPTPEPSIEKECSNKSQAFRLFQNVLHRAGHTAKSLITCGKIEDNCKRLVQ